LLIIDEFECFWLGGRVQAGLFLDKMVRLYQVGLSLVRERTAGIVVDPFVRDWSGTARQGLSGIDLSEMTL